MLNLSICNYLYNIMYALVAMATYTAPPSFACIVFQVRDTKNVHPLPPMTPTQSFPQPPMLGGPPPPPGPMYPPPPPGVSPLSHLT